MIKNSCWQDAQGYELESQVCSQPIASGNSIVFRASNFRSLLSQPINTTDAVALQFVFGNSGCGFGSVLYPVYLEYSVNGTSYLLKKLRTTTPVLFSVLLPMLARDERVQFSWNQLSGFIADEEIWQLDNVALLYTTTINSPLLGTFSGLEESSPIMVYLGGNVENNTCGVTGERLSFTGSNELPQQYVLTKSFVFGSINTQETPVPSCYHADEYRDSFDSTSYSYLLWERVEGGQVLKPPCDDVSTNPVLVFSTNRPSELITVPLNLTMSRSIKFDLQIARIFLNGSCNSLAEETVILSYRIGTNDQWKTLGEYASEDYFVAKKVSIVIIDCMQTCGVQLKWTCLSTELTAFWSIDNIKIGDNRTLLLVNRREANDFKLKNGNAHKRQVFSSCNSYFDEFESGNYNSTFWDSIRGYNVLNNFCQAQSFWLFFSRSYTRSATTRSLDLQGLTILTFYLVFGSGSTGNGCDEPSSGEGIFVDYNSNGTWENLEYYYPNCCAVATKQRIILPRVAQRSDVYLRWRQPRLVYNRRYSGYDVWGIDRIKIDSMPLYEDTFDNTSIWLSLAGENLCNSCCRRNLHHVHFSGNHVRQAVTHYLNISEAAFRVSFYLGKCEFTQDETIEISWRKDDGAWLSLKNISLISDQNVSLGIYDGFGINSLQFRISQSVFSFPIGDRWFINDFAVHSYNASHCSVNAIPGHVQTTPTSSTSSCSYYSDNFDDGLYKTSLWYTVSGTKISYRPCGFPLTQHYAMLLNAPTARQLITQMLDLRGVKYVNFKLKSCRHGIRYSYTHWLSVAYSKAGNGVWYTIKHFFVSCCFANSGIAITLKLPVEAQTHSVQLRWLDNSTTVDYWWWILDDVQIGDNVQNILYQDSFTTNLNIDMWSLVIGGSVINSPCGTEVDAGAALFFSDDGIRKAITQFLDLREANAISFYIRTASYRSCNGLDDGEAVLLSIRSGYGDWTIIQSYTNISNKYSYVDIPNNMKLHSVQLQWVQNVPAIAGYDVWAIDSIKVHSTFLSTVCSNACISDNFNSGTYNTSVWSSVSGAQIIVSPCSIESLPSKALYFGQINTTRQVITYPMDLQGMYAISFYLQLVNYNGTCSTVDEDHIVVYYSIDNQTSWIEIESFTGGKFATNTYVTIPLPLEAKNPSTFIRLAQPNYTNSIWSIDDFGIYSPNHCPPSLNSTIEQPTTSPTPNPSSSLLCNYYYDNFDSGTYKSNLWSSVSGVEITLTPCQHFTSLRRYGILFNGQQTRQLLTYAMDLRGVDLISFYLISGRYYECTLATSNKGIYVSYRTDASSSWSIMEYYPPYCCRGGKQISIYIPSSLQVAKVYLRWSQPIYSSAIAEWVLDDVRIGSFVETSLYSDEFADSYNHSVWRLILGGSVIMPPCGATYSGNALYFSQGGKREAITNFLDLRDARSFSFYLRIGSNDNTCEQPEEGENIELSYRINFNAWTTLQTFFTTTAFRDSVYVYYTIDETLQKTGVQFRFRQLVLSASSYDVWSIDNFGITSIEQDTKCSMACYSDNFNSGSYNSEFWSSVVIASITIPPCSTDNYGKSLYFTDGGTREAITNSLDLRGLYAITFTIQIGSFDGKCDQAEIGDDVILYYLLPSSSNWVELKHFSAAAYIAATSVTIPIPRDLRVQDVKLRWAQPQHSGLLQDTWFIDNVGIYSPNQCPPNAYSVQQSNSYGISTPASKDTLICNYYFDNFNSGTYKSEFWGISTNAIIGSETCGLSSSPYYAINLGSSSQLITHVLDLRGVEFITFYSQACYTPFDYYRSSYYNGALSVAYSINGDNVWHSIEIYDRLNFLNGVNVTIYLPKIVQVNFVQLRWLHSPYVSSDTWILDNVQIGEYTHKILYQDSFTINLSTTMWTSVIGGSVVIPPCGAIDMDNALFFAQGGTRKAITNYLDLRDANAVSFYINTASSQNCDGLDNGETVKLSMRVANGNWKTVQNYGNAGSTYYYVNIPESMKVHSVQLQWIQNLPAIAGYDVWAIDTVKIHSVFPSTKCSIACISDNFNSGTYNASVWSYISGAQVATSPCSTKEYSKSLYFNQSYTRQAITYSLDLQRMYAISFQLQLVNYNGTCSAVNDDLVIVYYSNDNENNWIELDSFNGNRFVTETFVTIPLPLEAKNQSVFIQIAQPNYLHSAWSIDDFGIYSSTQCSSEQSVTTIVQPTPLPTPSANTLCNYYWDNFDSGTYKNDLWSSLVGVQVELTPCQQDSALQKYGVVFNGRQARQLITNALDLRGVDFISFFLISGGYINRQRYQCSRPSFNHGIYVSYRIGTASFWNELEYFSPDCCRYGRHISVYIPPSAKVTSVYLRWYQQYYSSYVPQWALDDVKVGNFIENPLYSDEFTNNYKHSIWRLVSGGSVTVPPCGATYSDNALYFSQGEKREAITNFLDLREASSFSFYIRVGSNDDTCEQPEEGENIELSFRINFKDWTTLQMFSAAAFRDSEYVYYTINETLQKTGVQFRFRQLVLSASSYDVWSIDNFAITSIEQDTKCSMACYSDNFNSGSYNSEFWSSEVIASITIPPCSTDNYGKSLYFTDGGAREAITNSLDLRGLYAITFTIQIGSFDGKCDQAETGDDVILYYLLPSSSNWVELEQFNATAYLTATTVTVPIPRDLRAQDVKLRWAQPQHSGLLQDTWFIDNVGVYSPNQCPPNVHVTSTLSPSVVLSSSSSTALKCNYYFDNFNDGSYKIQLWDNVIGLRISSSPCTLPSTKGYAMEFYSNSERELVTQVLDLRGVDSISFYLLSSSNHGGNGCSQSNVGLYVGYRMTYSTIWHNLEYFAPDCCSNGTTFTLQLPDEAKVNSVQLRWWQLSYVSFTDWVLDDVEIGSIIDTALYKDSFTRTYNSELWSLIGGGNVIIPPCGTIDSGSVLHFSGSGFREAVTTLLDLRQATAVSFYLQIGSTDSTCENAEVGEDLELSYKMRNSDWTLLQIYTSSSYRTARYVYIDIPSNIKINGVTLRITQNVIGTDSYDVWSIDTFVVHSKAHRPECSKACYMDYFNSKYNRSLWSTVIGGVVAPLLCNTNEQYSNSLKFNGSDMRYAMTKDLDLSGLYAISFSLQIVLNDDECSLPPYGEDIILSYSVNGSTWNEFRRFGSRNYDIQTDVIIELPVNARQPNVVIQIMQPYHVQSIWAFDNFGIYSPNSCPPVNYRTETTITSPTPVPYQNPSNKSTICNYYFDNFDNGFYKISLWSAAIGVRVASQPCGLPYLQHYGIEFYSFGTRELSTDLLDLRGVELIYFYLLSGSNSNGCSQPSSNEGMHVAYTIGSSSIYNNLEYYEPSCCSTGAYFKVHLPSSAQTTSVSIRWYQSTHTPSERADVWILDDVQIGINVDNHFYEDYFSNSINSALWHSVVGASVATPPCGVTHSSDALYFSANGTRQAITQLLDLRHATGLSFYLRIGSFNGRCENDDSIEAITLLWRINYNSWMNIGSYGYFRESRYVYFSFTDNMKVTGVQFQLQQSTTPAANEDVWSIDDFIVHSMHKDTLCTLACYSDDFNNGQYSSSLWAMVDGASVTVPACSNQYLGSALYFNGDGIRQAITKPIDIRGFYALSFYLHIGSFSGSCEQAESGEHVNLHYQLANSTRWMLLSSYGTTDFIRETRVTEALPRDISQVGVTFRWMQASHSGALDDAWSVDNVGFYSPNECPPIGFESVNITNTTTATATTTTTTTTEVSSSAIISHSSIIQPSRMRNTPTMLSTSTSASSVTGLTSMQTSATVQMSTFSGIEPTPTTMPLPDNCVENFDPLNSGIYSSSLWSSLTGVNVEVNPCRVRIDDAMLFYGFASREAITVSLNLTDVSSISFMLQSGSLNGNCVANNNAVISVSYMEVGIPVWINISTYYPTDYTIEQLVLLSLPTGARKAAVKLRWYQLWYSGYRQDVWSLDDVLIGAVDTPYFNEPTTGYVDDFNTGEYSLMLWDTIIGGNVQVPPCGPTVVGAALYFSNNNGSQLCLTKVLDLTGVSTLSFYLGLTTCSSTAEVSPTILLEYSTADGPFIILQVLVVNGNQIISLPSDVQTSNVRLQWRSLLNAKWSLDNVRIGSDALLYYLQFEIQVGSCSSPPINGSESDHVNLEYYDGSSWSLLQNECLHPKCFLMTEGSMYSANRYYRNQRVVIPLWALIIRNRPMYQLRWGVNNPTQWSVDNVYIGKGCPNYCQGLGYCNTFGYCQCDSGATGSACLIGAISNPQTVISDFNNVINATFFPILYGALLSTQCGVLSSGESLVFKYGKHREIQTQDLDTTKTLYIQFTFTSGRRNCGGAVTTENPILLQFSLDKGITWNLLRTLSEPFGSFESYHIVMPSEAKYSQTRFRIWQPYAVADNYNIWSIDNFLIGGIDRNIPTLVQDFDSLDANNLAFYPGGVVESYCSSEGNSLHFNGQFLGSYLSTLEYHITADTFMQFDLITTCASNTALQYYIKLEYSKDGGLTWEVVSIAQEGFRNQYLAIYHSKDYTDKWKRVTLPLLNQSTYGTAVRFKWIQMYTASSMIGDWAIDNIVIGNRSLHCPQLCNGHGRCTPSSVCICDEGFSGNNCEEINIIFPNYVQESFEEDLDSSLWPVVVGGGINTDCGIISLGKSLVLNSDGYRYVTTSNLNLTKSTCMQFTLQIGSELNSPQCPVANGSQHSVAFGYSTNNGLSWTIHNLFQPANYSTSQQVIISLNNEAQSPAVQLGWWQMSASQSGAFAIDNVLIGSSASDAKLIYNDTFESGNYTSLWWSLSTGANVSQFHRGSNALVFGANLAEKIATTKPLLIPSAPTTPVLLYEGFNDNNSTRLMEEGWNFTGHMSSLCGHLYENSSALTFLTVLDRSVITRPVDTTYATHVSFYLLFGTSVQFCSGINDANKGIQLSYLNDDSDEWVQIAYFSDTIYFMTPKQITKLLPMAARRPNTRLRWYQPNHSSVILQDTWSIDEIAIYKKPLNYDLQFSYIVSCNANKSSRIEIEYISNSTDCTWMPITHSVLPNSCDDLSTTYFQPTQLMSSTWTRVTVSLPSGAFSPNTQFRWREQGNYQNCQYALDDVYIGPGCPNGCNNQGVCINGECSCNEGYSGPACMPVSAISELREEFSQYPLNSSLWSFVNGNNENAQSQCGRLTGTNSLSFSGITTRQLVTNDINTVNSLFIEFIFRLGSSGTDGDCNPASTPSESVVLQYSIDGGSSWDNLAILCYNQLYNPMHLSYELPPQSQTSSTRFRWWQPSHNGVYQGEWAITDLFIGGNLEYSSIEENFDPVNNNYWLFYSGADILPYCNSQGNALVFYRDGFISTRDFYITSNHVIRFELNLLACNCVSALSNAFYIEIEYSVDRGNHWRLLNADAVFSPLSYQGWKDVAISVPDPVANQTLRLRWIQSNIGYSCWALNNIRIENSLVFGLMVISSNSIMLTWEPFQQNGIIQYHVIISETQILYSSDGTVTSAMGININRTYEAAENYSQLINRLHPNYNYTVRMAVTTTSGTGLFSIPKTVKTFEDAPSGPPLNIQLTAESFSSAMLSWEPPLPEQQNGRIVRYHVIVRDAGFALNRNLTYGVNGGYIQLIDRLDADTSYAIRIAAATNAGIGPFSVTRTVTTLRNVIVPVIAPSNVIIRGSNSYRQGNVLELRCSSTGDPPFQYRWTRVINGVNNAFPAGIITTNNVLHINNVLVSDGGNYTCTVTNDVGSSSSTTPVYTLDLLSAANQVQLVNVLDTVSFNCEVSGVPVPFVNWSMFEQGIPIDAISNGRVFVAVTTVNSNTIMSTLTIRSIQLNDAGTYICSVFNGEISAQGFFNMTTVPLLQATADRIIALESQSVSISCIPTPNNLVVMWVFNGTKISRLQDITFIPTNLNHTLTINGANISNSGYYTCQLIQTFNMPISRTITLEVLQTCEPEYRSGLLWDRRQNNQLARIRCSMFHSNFRSGVYITRMCNENGEWGNIDFSSCTMRANTNPLLVFEINSTSSIVDVEGIFSDIRFTMSRANLTLSQSSHQVFTVSSLTMVAVFVTVNDATLPDNIVARIFESLVGNNQVTSITAFQPEYQCACNDPVRMNSLKRVCIGPSVPPCSIINGNYQCTTPTYAGNGVRCGLDSDSDGYPDVQLNCPDQSCEQDACPTIFNDNVNSPDPCTMQVQPGTGSSCVAENDTVWGILWQPTSINTTAVQKCPGLSESAGLAYRRCLLNAEWDVVIDVSQCHTVELTLLDNRINELETILNDNTDNGTRNLTVMFDIMEVQIVSEELVILTDTSQGPILPNDLNTTNDILDVLIDVTRISSREMAMNETAQNLDPILETASTTIDNLLNSSNELAFEQSQNAELSVAEDLLRNTENLAVVVGDVLMATAANNTGNNSKTIMKENLVLNAQLPPANPEEISTIVFPENSDTQVTIPSSAIIYQRNTEGVSVPVVNFIANNLQGYLNHQSLSEIQGTAAGMVLSSQISNGFIELPENSSVTLRFSNLGNVTDFGNVQCVFWDFNRSNTSNQSKGGWSTEGIIQDNDPTLPVLCSATHLTSFCVLVSAEEFEEIPSLRIVSYIGCGISIVCLIVTIGTIILFRKTTFKGTHNSIHLNLSIALLLGLVVFVSGIESAKNDRVGCIFVTTLLHYLFLSVFSWTLCEGIIMFIMFYSVFYHGYFRHIYFYLLIGWGLPIPLVILSAGLSYKNYGVYANDMRLACWISDKDGAIWAFTAPMIFVNLVNVFFLCSSLYKVYQGKKQQIKFNAKEQSRFEVARTLLWSTLALLPLLGCTWIIGLLFVVNSESKALAWIFTIVNSLQGLTIFFFHVLNNKKVIKTIQDYCQKRQRKRRALAHKESLGINFLPNQLYAPKSNTLQTNVESRMSTIHQDTSFIDDDKTTLAKHDALMY